MRQKSEGAKVKLMAMAFENYMQIVHLASSFVLLFVSAAGCSLYNYVYFIFSACKS